jgi:hypothetical protein
MGLGRKPIWKCLDAKPDSTSAVKLCNSDGSDRERPVETKILQGSLDYRLGIRDSWGPFPGVELQWHLEAPTNPATMEFALNVALPAGPNFHHKLGGGWGIGAWADNSLFLEYAISKKMGLPLIFGNLRATWLATQIDEVMRDDFSKPLPSNQILIAQMGMGAFFQLPDWRVLPDFLIPQVNFTAPQLISGDYKFRGQDIPMLQWDLGLGIGWSF